MVEDTEGFLYPKVDAVSCVNCGLCEKVCHELHPYGEHLPIEVLAGQSYDDEIRRSSSSGGLFSLLASECIKNGGVVFGVRFDENWQCKLDYAETLEGLKVFRGSKYVQARTDTAYIDALRFLKEGRIVLFSGTPCQIAGLKHFVRRAYDNLYTIDVICHGVPSPKVWKLYINQEIKKARKGENTVSLLPNHLVSEGDTLLQEERVEIEGFFFRDKRLGWRKYSFTLTLAEATADGKKNTVSLSSIYYKNSYMRAFLNNLDLRPSCSSCQAKAGRSHSDITLADCWGAELEHKAIYDDLGTNSILVNTEKGKALLSQIIYKSEQSNYSLLLEHNAALVKSYKPHPKREEFFRLVNNGEADITHIVKKLLDPPMWKQFLNMPMKIVSYIRIHLFSK
ncbi:MAG: Coenzyme F420 hydrogenase/dehydrogenase, beta subunit C-terminal domain [Bacteroidaceae bacterium]|nr:Coenzyme F420 hydrogenase/dehydrogenase, beta subunit C-terminal domain [Bacteroidaceae bacterium]